MISLPQFTMESLFFKSKLRTARVDAEDANVFSLQLLCQKLGENGSSSVGLSVSGARVIIFAVL